MTESNINIIVVDEFYKAPELVRQMAMCATYASAAAFNFPGWQSTKAYVPAALSEVFSGLLGETVSVDPARVTWGQFRIIQAEAGAVRKVHADRSIDWAGMVYLTPGLTANEGTGFFEHATGFAGPPTDHDARRLGFADATEFDQLATRPDSADPTKWKLLDVVEPRFNRLVLFRGSALYHAPLGGAGTEKHSGRLTQNFFFNAYSHRKLPIGQAVSRSADASRDRLESANDVLQ